MQMQYIILPKSYYFFPIQTLAGKTSSKDSLACLLLSSSRDHVTPNQILTNNKSKTWQFFPPKGKLVYELTRREEPCARAAVKTTRHNWSDQMPGVFKEFNISQFWKHIFPWKIFMVVVSTILVLGNMRIHLIINYGVKYDIFLHKACAKYVLL